MIKKPLIKLILHIEKEILSILKVRGYITRDSSTFNDAEISSTARNKFNIDYPIVSKKWVQNYQQLWPSGHRGNYNVLIKELIRFLDNHDVSLQEITEATELWLQKRTPPYCGNPNNFFRVKHSSGATISRCLDCIEEIRETKTQVIHGDELIDPDE